MGVYHPSGHTVVHHPSGHTVVYHPSGHAVVYHPSGHVVVHYPSGHTVVHHRSGHAVVHHPSGHTVVHHPSGHRVVHNPWGGVTVHPPMWHPWNFATANVTLSVPHAQGDASANETVPSRATTLPDAVLLDGTLLQDNSTGVKSDIDFDKDKDLAMLYKTNWWGPQVMYHPSGHAVVYHPSGHVVVHHPSGHTVVHHRSGHRVVHHPWGGVTVHPPMWHPWHFATANVTLSVPHAQGPASANETVPSRATTLPD